MYNKRDASRLRQEFWTAFGKYMSPVPSTEGGKVNWINYHTGVKGIFFRMDVSNNSASISISLENSDDALRDRQWDQLKKSLPMLHSVLSEEWTWQKDSTSDNRTISRVYKDLPGASVFNKDQWPDLISFFKPRLIALDEFWESAKWNLMEV
jgi:Domain of unknown function (DUF4268)